MKILVFGNVGSGKSTIVKKLKEVLNWHVISIDDFRRKYGNGSKEKELIAQEHFLNASLSKENQIIECLGVGKVAIKLSTLLSKRKDRLICLKLITSKEICKLRLKSRIWDIPFPEPIDKVNELIDKTEDRIIKGEIEIIWSKHINSTIISKENYRNEDIDDIVQFLINMFNKFTFT